MFQSLTRETLNLRIWEEDICCRITHRQPICTSYGTHALFLFNRLSNTGRHLQLITADSPKDAFASIIGNSPQISELINQARKAAGYKATVLIEGESGTGKELIAQAIHKESGRSGKFIAINCGAIPSELIQSELFGYDEGAFTGAKKKGNPGKLEMADKGTVFLDEIGEMPLDMQVNLLRFLQDKTITRVGGNQSHKIDVRIIAATNRNLKEEVEKGNFREDLYYRLNVIHLQVPPLRERREDIPVLAHFFVEKLSQEYGIDEPIISAAAMRTLLDYDWPGNVREMENQIERAMILSAGYELRFDNLISSVSDNAEGIEGITADKERIEKEGIENYLRQYQGNISHTAKALGITRQTLYRKIKSLNIQREKLGVTPMDASHQAPNEKS
jgi:transcriptional regulator with PAS, ATPase and Fis domain